jgi:hypothetical protein
MAMSLVLLVADIQNDVHLGPVIFFVHAPFTITMVLWIVWAYWLWRYYTSFHDIGEKGFLRTYRERLQILGHRICIKRIIRGYRAEFAAIHAKFREMNLNGTRQLMVFNSSYARGGPSPWHLSLNVNLGLKDLDGILALEGIGPAQNVTVEGVEFLFTAARAWCYVIFRTTLFTEYLLPFLFAFAVALYAVYVCASHVT